MVNQYFVHIVSPLTDNCTISLETILDLQSEAPLTALWNPALVPVQSAWVWR